MDNESKIELTYGQKAVGLTFNPSGNYDVEQCKIRFAQMIDEMALLRVITDIDEKKRYCSIAITEMQTAQMWMVKALTCKD